MNKFRTGWISDLHLGTRGCNADAVLQFLRDYEFETLYIVGDLLDIWSLRRSRYWPQAPGLSIFPATTMNCCANTSANTAA
jgi:UDP-2,3-diacylglucosamine pyrophosphatase LpxH